MTLKNELSEEMQKLPNSKYKITKEAFGRIYIK
jgi:hypothetical protein